MIILTRLQVRDFKSLREIDLHFPPRASILVEGLNEAGKSTLFESIYFALYGEPLIAEDTGARGKKRYDTAIRHGAEASTVTLALDVDGTALVVTRTLRRGKSTTARLAIRRPDGGEEVVADQVPVTERLVQELGNLDKEALLNSCFVEQKKLAKLEEMDSSERQRSLAHLLNLDKLQRLEQDFKVTRQDELAEVAAARRYELARAQAAIPRLEAELLDIRRQLAAAEIQIALAEIASQRESLARLEAEHRGIARDLEQIEQVRARIAAVKGAREGLAALARHIENLARHHAEAERQGREMAELDRREQEDLPALSQRIEDLEQLAAAIQRSGELDAESAALAGTIAEQRRLLEDIDRRAPAAQRLAAELEEEAARIDRIEAEASADEQAAEEALTHLEPRQTALRGLQAALAERHALERDYQAAQESAGRARRDAAAFRQILSEIDTLDREERDLLGQFAAAEAAHQAAGQAFRAEAEARQLEAWLQGRRTREALEGRQAAETEAARQVENAELELRQRRESAGAAGRRIAIPAVVAGAAIIAGSVLLFFDVPIAALALIVAGLIAAGSALAGAAGLRERRASAEQATAALEAARHEEMKVSAERAAAETLGGGATHMASAESELRALGAAVPAAVSEAEARLAELRDGQAAADLSALRAALEQCGEAMRELAGARTRLSDRRALLRGQADEHPGADPAALERAEQAAAGMQQLLDEQREQIEVAAAGLSVPPAAEAIAEALAEVDSAISGHRAALAALPSRRDHIASLRQHLAGRREQLAAELAWLAGHDHVALLAGIAELENGIERAKEAKAGHDAGIAAQAAGLGVVPTATAVQREHGAAQSDRRRLLADLEGRLDLAARRSRLRGQIEQEEAQVKATWRVLLPLPEGVTPEADGLPVEQEIARLDTELKSKLADLDEGGVAARRSELDRRRGEVEQQIRNARAAIDIYEGSIRQELAAHGLAAEPDAERIGEVFPEFGDVAPGQRDELLKARHDVFVELESRSRERDKLAAELFLHDVTLDEAECAAEVAALRREIEVKKRAGQIVLAARQRMMERVRPSTERNMELLLPLLTLDRYRDCRINPHDYRLTIWDEQAGRYVAKNIFSGGTRDQFSLALRLAFALATLPQEKGATPGFIFLDEPLSSFDGPRSEALINLLTRGQVAASFQQIFVISHNRMFDPAAFTHHLLMEGGRVAEHDFDRLSSSPAVAPALP